jgi:hypothetical protein
MGGEQCLTPIPLDLTEVKAMVSSLAL